MEDTRTEVQKVIAQHNKPAQQINGDTPKHIREDWDLNSPFVFQVTGRYIKIREIIPIEQGYLLPELVNKIDRNDLRSQIPVMAFLIEDWEFEGSPQDPESYTKIDTITQFMPISRTLQDHINIGAKSHLGNGGSGFGSLSRSTTNSLLKK